MSNRNKIQSLAIITVFTLISVLPVIALFQPVEAEKKYFFEINFISDPANIDAVEIMKRGWEEIGIKVNVITMEFSSLYAKYRFVDSFPGATHAEGGYDLAFTGWPMPPDPDTMDYYHTEAQPGRSAASSNTMMYSNGEVDKLLEEGVQTTDENRRVEIYRRVEEIIHEELPLLYTYRDPAIKATTANLDLGDSRTALASTGIYDWAWQFEFTDQEGGTMVFVGDQNPPGLNGVYPITTVGVNNARLVQGRLLRDGIPYGSYEPDLAESYEISEDNLVYTFYLREGVKWHDGEPFNAEDVKFSFDLYMNPEAGFSGYGYWQKYVKEVRIVDEYTIELELNSVYAPALYRFANSPTILPKHILENVPPIELKSHIFNKEPIGTGPFKVVEWVDDEYIKYEAFADYWRGPPALDDILFRIISDKATGVAALEAGEVNLIEQQIYRAALIQNYDRLKDKEDLTITISPDTGVNPMLINLKHPAMGNLYVRKAMAHAIDIEGIIEGPYAGLGVKTPQRYPPIMEPYFNPELTHYEYNIETAKQLMETAGYHYSSLEATTTPTPSETQESIVLPVAVSLIIGAAIGFVVDRFVLKKE